MSKLAGIILFISFSSLFSQVASAAYKCAKDVDNSGSIDQEYELRSCGIYYDGKLCPIDSRSCSGSYSSGFSCPYGQDNECIDKNPNHPPHKSCRITYDYSSGDTTGISPVVMDGRSENDQGGSGSCGPRCTEFFIRSYSSSPPGQCTTNTQWQRLKVVNRDLIESVYLSTQNHAASGVVDIDGVQVYESPNYPDCEETYGEIESGKSILDLIGGHGSTFTHTSSARGRGAGVNISKIKVIKKDTCGNPEERVSNTCESYENNAQCFIRNEWVDGIQTIRNFKSTGKQPAATTKTFGKSCPTSKTVTRNDWDTKREYVCPEPGYEPDMECSEQTCADTANGGITHVEEVPDKPKSNNNAFDENGNCIGEIEIFSGKAARCRKSGVQTSWQNCCKSRQNTMSDTMGSSSEENSDQSEYIGNIGIAAKLGIDAGSKAANDFLKTAFEPATMAFDIANQILNEFFVDTCDEKDLETAFMNNSGYCVYLGETCREEWEFIGCVQKQKVYCCFNSRLSAIIQREGRKQLESLSGFGSKRKPNCRGFTPEEFQAIDFSRIDMSEYYEEIQHTSQDSMKSMMQEKAQEYEK